MAKPFTFTQFKSALFFIVSLSLIAISLFSAYLAVEARYSVLEFYFSQAATPGKDRGLILISNMSFYAGLLAWYAAVCWPVFKSSLLKRTAITVALVAYLLFSWFLSKTYFVGSGQALFSVYYLFTQFNIYQYSYFSFAFLVIAFSVGFVFISATATLLASIKQKSRIRLAALAVALCLFALSFIQLSTAPKYINLANWPYLLSSAKFTPKQDGFYRVAAEKPKELSLENTSKPNIVIIVLESTRRDAISFYNPEARAKTPFIDSLAENGAVFTQMQTTVPNTLKSLVAINCGVAPYLNYPILESTMGVPSECIAEKLTKLGYATRFVQSATMHYGNIQHLVEQLGYQKFLAAESFDRADFHWVDFTGLDDRVILEDNQRWLESVEPPFLASYLTVGPHFPYTLYDKESKQQYFSSDDEHIPQRYRTPLNNYRNAVVHQDDFLSQLISQYEAAGKLENSIFVLVGDHGTSFGEHPISQRLNNVYEEALAVPLIIYAPSYIKKPAAYDDLVSHSDVPFIISNLINGRALTQDIHRETVFSSCWYWSWCIARKDSRYKYIYNFANGPDELYDLLVDAREKHNIADLQPEKVKQFRQEALAWYYQQLANYGSYYGKMDPDFYIKGHPVTTKAILPSFSSIEQE